MTDVDQARAAWDAARQRRDEAVVKMVDARDAVAQAGRDVQKAYRVLQDAQAKEGNQRCGT